MKRTIRITVTIVFMAAIAAAFLHNKTHAGQAPARGITGEESDRELILALNDCIQERFKDVDQTFGYRRIVRIGETAHRFTPENAKEIKIVDELKKVGLKSALYLAGRRSVDTYFKLTDLKRDHVIKGPGLITADDKQKKSLPKASELFEHSRKAMAAFEKSNSYDFTLAGWKFTALAVRASDQSCLMCHKHDNYIPYGTAVNNQMPPELKVGDVLGVVIYAYGNSR